MPDPGRENKPTQQSLAKPSTLFAPRTKVIFSLVMVVGALFYFGFTAFQNATVQYMRVDELAAQGSTPDGRMLGVSGKLVPHSYHRSPDGLVANFEMKDEDGSQAVPVKYAGEVGQVFFNEHSELILQGTMGDDGVFTADHLTVRCPSKYLTEQERAEIEAQDSGEPLSPPYQSGEYGTSGT